MFKDACRLIDDFISQNKNRNRKHAALTILTVVI